MGDDCIPRHPWSWFHLRRFLRRAWPGLLAIAILVSAWLVYGLFAYEQRELAFELSQISTKPLEDFTFDDPAWLFIDCVGPERRYAVLSKHDGSSGRRVYSTAVLDLATSRTVAHVEVGHAFVLQRVFYREGEILLGRLGTRKSWSAGLVWSLGRVGYGLSPSRETELIRIDLETGLPSEPIPLGSPFYPTDLSADGRLIAGNINSERTMSGSGIFDLDSQKLLEYPASGIPIFEDSNDLMISSESYITRIETGTGRVSHHGGRLTPQQRDVGFSAQTGMVTSGDDGAPRHHYTLWQKVGHSNHESSLRYMVQVALDGSLDQTLYPVDPEMHNRYVATKVGSFWRYPAMLCAELGILLFIDPTEAVFWNYRANRYYRLPRQNQNEIVQLLNARFVADKTGNRFRIHRVEDYFPPEFLGEERTP